MEKHSSSPIESLPPELFREITDHHLDHPSLLALSSTTPSFRALLSPRVFRSLKITNDPSLPWSGLTSLAAYLSSLAPSSSSSSSASSFTTLSSLSFVGKQTGSRVAFNKGRRRPLDLPEPCRAALSGELFFKIDTLEVSFDFGNFEQEEPEEGEEKEEEDEEEEDEYNVWDYESEITGYNEINSIYVFEVAETDLDGQIRKKEKIYPWRKLMAEVWGCVAAAAAGGGGGVRKLVAKGLIPKPTSSWFGEEWKKMLLSGGEGGGLLEELEISMWSGDNGAGWHANTMDGYVEFEEKLGEYFFGHCGPGVRRVRLEADPATGFGANSMMFDCGSPFKVGMGLGMPGLERLELVQLLLSRDLAEFIVKASSEEKLRSVLLQDCNVSSDSDGGVVTWAEFLVMLDREEMGLTELEIRYDYLYNDGCAPCPMTEKELWGYGDGDEEKDAEVARIRETTERKGFSYGGPSDKYGDVWRREEENADAFILGDDDRAFRRLMGRIARNQGNSGP